DLPPGDAWSPGDLKVSLLHEPFDQPVEQLCQLPLDFLVATPAAQRLEHLAGELPTLDEGPQEGVFQALQRALGVVELAPERVVVGPPGEATLQEKVRQLLEE